MDPILRGDGQGETIADEPDRAIRLLGASEQIAVAEFRYGPGKEGPPRHIHREHADGFFVVEGELSVELADAVEHVSPGGFVLAPPGLVHTFRNESGEVVRFLNFHTPNSGYDDFLRALRDRSPAAARFDQHAPPADGGRPAADALVRPAGEGTTLAMPPAGFEAYLVEAAAAITPGAPSDPAALAAIGAKYGLEPAT